MKNLKLRTKFTIVVIPVFVLVIILTFLINGMAKNTLNTTKTALYDELYVASSNLINADRDFYQAYVAAIQLAFNAGDPDELNADRDENYKQTSDRVAAAVNSISSNEDLYKVYTIDSLLTASGQAPEGDAFSEKTMERLYQEFSSFLSSWNNAANESAAVYNFNEARDRLNAMEDLVDAYATYKLNATEALLARQLTAVIIFVIIITLLVILLMIYVIFSMLSNIKKVNSNLAELANNNLTFEPELVAGKDEIAEMSNGVLALKKSLIEAIGSVNNASEVLSSNIAAVTAGNTRSSQGMSNINLAITEVADTSQQVANSSVMLNEKTDEIGNAIEAIAENIHELRDASSQIEQINLDASKSMDHVLISSEQSVSAVNDISVQINNTNDAVLKIEECIQVISDISAQTNLLSLNASIEAARAGEAGRGFAVVAEEIRTLADSSAQSADEIRTIVNNVTEMSNKTVILAKDVSEVILKQQEDVKLTQEKFSQLTSAVEQNLSGIDAIQQMSAGLEQVKVELADATSTLSAISEELGASAQEVSATCSQVADECENTNDMSNEMATTKDDLINAVAVFKI